MGMERVRVTTLRGGRTRPGSAYLTCSGASDDDSVSLVIDIDGGEGASVLGTGTRIVEVMQVLARGGAL